MMGGWELNLYVIGICSIKDLSSSDGIKNTICLKSLNFQPNKSFKLCYHSATVLINHQCYPLINVYPVDRRAQAAILRG